MKKQTKSADKHPAQEPIAIIGMGCIYPKAQTLRDYWANIKGKVDAITDVPPTHWKAEDYFDPDPKKPDFTYAKRGGFVPTIDFDPSEYAISPSTLEAIDTSQILGLVVAHAALVDAGYDPQREYDRERISVILGLTGALEMVVPLGARLGHPKWRNALKKAGVPDDISKEVMANIGESYVSWQENSFPGLLGNVAAGRIANRFNLGGTNCVVDAACASSFSAVHLGMMELQTGKAKMVITGGIDTFNDIFMYMCFSKTPALSPSGDAKPFDVSGDGTILGEGLGMVVLKRLSDAEKDGDKIYAVIKSVGTSSDGKGKSIYAPSATGQMKALRRAYEEAGVGCETIEMVETHGTGTKVGDAVEVDALTQVFSESKYPRPWCAVGSVKSQIGHTKAAAGSAGLIKVAQSLYYKVLPPTIKVTTPNPAAFPPDSPLYVNAEKRPWVTPEGHPRRGSVSSFGFGGSNFHLVLEEYRPQKAEIDWDGNIELVALSGKTPEEIEQQGKVLSAPMSWVAFQRKAAEARRDFSPKAAFRAVLIVERNKTVLADALNNAVQSLKTETTKTVWNTPDGCYLGKGERKGKLAAVFPGQGAQYPNMGLDLACMFPEVLETLAIGNEAFASPDPIQRLSDRIFPRAAFTPEEKKRHEDGLRDTSIAQPAIGAVCIGALKVLRAFGIQPEAAAGHSFGEVAAMYAAGIIDEKSFFQIAKTRGELMSSVKGEKGSMIAVSAPLADIEKAVAEEKLDLVFANKNAPKQTVLSGKLAEIERAAAAFTKRKMRGTVLQVSGAFHSPLVADAAKPFRELLDKMTFHNATMPVYSNTTGGRYPEAGKAVKDLLGNQLAKPVEFVTEIEAMYKDGYRTFLEVGPGARMSGLIKSILEGRDVSIVAVDASSGQKSGLMDLAKTLAFLAAAGETVNLLRWEDAETKLKHEFVEKKPRMTIPICGANYRAPYTPRPAKPPLSLTTGSGASTPALVASVPSATPMASAPAAATPTRQAVSASPTPIPVTVQPNFHLHATGHAHAAGAPVKSTSMVGSMNTLPQHPHSQVPSTPAGQPAPQQVPATLDAFRMAQQSLLTLQQLQLQTADLHRRFLEGQETAQRTIQSLIHQQTGLLSGAPVQVTGYAPALQPALAAPLSMPQPMYAPAPQAYSAPAPMAAPAYVPAPMVQAPAPVPVHAPVQPAAQAQRPVAAPVAPAAPAAGGLSADTITKTVVAVVSEKTGYPNEMLNLDMDMESDLGIDSIKRVEIMSAVQEKLPEAPVMKPEQLGKIRTLGQVIAYLTSGAPTGATNAPAAAAPATSVPVSAAPAASSSVAFDPILLSIVSEKTGYPKDMLNLDMNMESDLGIDSIKRVEIMSAVQEKIPEAPVIQPNQLGQFQTLRQIIDYFNNQMKSAAPVSQAAATPAPAAASAPSASSSASGGVSIEAILKAMVAIVSEKTGYPTEMLNLDMDMESDLGIDSIKRVEIMSAFQERMPNAPVVQPGDLGKFRTLRQVIDFVGSGNAGTAAAAATVAPQEAAAGVGESANLQRSVPASHPFEFGTRRTRLSIPQGSIVWITSESSGVSSALTQQFNAEGLKAEVVSLADLDRAQPPANLAGFVVIASPAAQGNTVLWNTDAETFLKQAFRAVQVAGTSLKANATKGGSFVLTVSRLDGHFGLTGNFQTSPLSGGLSGLAKTASHEWPGVSCKAMDVADVLNDSTAIAQAIVTEALHVGPQEVGLSRMGLHVIQEIDLPFSTLNAKPRAVLQAGDVVVISGGARGVTAETAIALAREFKPTLVLLGRTQPPQAEPAWLQGLEIEAQIKKGIMENTKGVTFTPKKLEEEYKRLMANREILRNIQRIEAAGSRVLYRSVDVRNVDALKGLFARIRSEAGPVRGLIHGAGVLRDKRIEDKTAEHFAEVFDTKIGGLKALLEAIQISDLRAVVFFSSVTGRYGRTGQVDYAMANEALNKIGQRLRYLQPDCRVVSINWGPWDGGMVTDSLKKVFHGEGIDLIPLAAGARQLVHELWLEPTEHPVEVVVGGKFAQVEVHTTKPVFAQGSTPVVGLVAEQAASPTTEKKTLGAVERTLSLSGETYLRSHVINGDAVLPVAMMFEILAHAALQENPGFTFHGYDDLRVQKGVIMKRGQAYSIRATSTKAAGRTGLQTVTVELRSGTEARPLIHARAVVVLAKELPGAPAPRLKPELNWQYQHSMNTVYDSILFHGPDLKAITEVTGWSPQGMAAKLAGSPTPSAWMPDPLRPSWTADPMAIDGAFQLMILWTHAQCGELSLPSYVKAYRQYAAAFPATGTRVVIQVEKVEGKVARSHIEFVDAQGKLLACIDGYESVMMPSLQEAFKKRSLEAGA